eukprot:g51.t1
MSSGGATMAARSQLAPRKGGSLMDTLSAAERESGAVRLQSAPLQPPADLHLGIGSELNEHDYTAHEARETENQEVRESLQRLADGMRELEGEEEGVERRVAALENGVVKLQRATAEVVQQRSREPSPDAMHSTMTWVDNNLKSLAEVNRANVAEVKKSLAEGLEEVQKQVVSQAAWITNQIAKAKQERAQLMSTVKELREVHATQKGGVANGEQVDRLIRDVGSRLGEVEEHSHQSRQSIQPLQDAFQEGLRNTVTRDEIVPYVDHRLRVAKQEADKAAERIAQQAADRAASAAEEASREHLRRTDHLQKALLGSQDQFNAQLDQMAANAVSREELVPYLDTRLRALKADGQRQVTEAVQTVEHNVRTQLEDAATKRELMPWLEKQLDEARDEAVKGIQALRREVFSGVQERLAAAERQNMQLGTDLQDSIQELRTSEFGPMQRTVLGMKQKVESRCEALEQYAFELQKKVARYETVGREMQSRLETHEQVYAQGLQSRVSGFERANRELAERLRATETNLQKIGHATQNHSANLLDEVRGYVQSEVAGMREQNSAMMTRQSRLEMGMEDVKQRQSAQRTNEAHLPLPSSAFDSMMRDTGNSEVMRSIALAPHPPIDVEANPSVVFGMPTVAPQSYDSQMMQQSAVLPFGQSGVMVSASAASPAGFSDTRHTDTLLRQTSQVKQRADHASTGSFGGSGAARNDSKTYSDQVVENDEAEGVRRIMDTAQRAVGVPPPPSASTRENPFEIFPIGGANMHPDAGRKRLKKVLRLLQDDLPAERLAIEELKDIANKMFVQQEFETAVEYFSKAIAIVESRFYENCPRDNTSKKVLAILYGNRCQCFLMLAREAAVGTVNFDDSGTTSIGVDTMGGGISTDVRFFALRANRDAAIAHALDPTNGKHFHRRGQALLLLSSMQQRSKLATKCFERALECGNLPARVQRETADWLRYAKKRWHDETPLRQITVDSGGGRGNNFGYADDEQRGTNQPKKKKRAGRWPGSSGGPVGSSGRGSEDEQRRGSDNEKAESKANQLRRDPRTLAVFAGAQSAARNVVLFAKVSPR